MREACIAALALMLWLWLITEAEGQTMPERDVPHPVTGETGTWIPLWLEREHVKDDAKLETCRADLETANQILQERLQQTLALEHTVREQNEALAAAEKILTAPAPKGPPPWLGVGAAVALLALVAAAIVVP